jgi:hypothetical protein
VPDRAARTARPQAGNKKRAKRRGPGPDRVDPATKPSGATVPSSAAADKASIGNAAATKSNVPAQLLASPDIGNAALTRAIEGAAAMFKDEELRVERREAPRPAGPSPAVLEDAGSMFEAESIKYERDQLLARVDKLEQATKDPRGLVARKLKARMPRDFQPSKAQLDAVVPPVLSWHPGLSPKSLGEFRARILPMTTRPELDVADTNVSKQELELATFGDRVIPQYAAAVLEAGAKSFEQPLKDDKIPQIGSLLAARYRTTAGIGALRRYYQSTHDKSEKNALGMSYDLDGTPFCVHFHTVGSGTGVTALSVKRGASIQEEMQKPVLSERWFREDKAGPELEGRIKEDLGRRPDSPANVVADIKSGARPPAPWSRKAATPPKTVAPGGKTTP